MAGHSKLFDKLAAKVAIGHARRVYERFRAATRRAVAVQEDVLLSRIRRNADSELGRRYRFDRISSVDDFVRHVPLMDYEAHRPYIERVKLGDLRAMFGPGQRVLMFALTSGTTDQPKYIPVTEDFLDEYRPRVERLRDQGPARSPEGDPARYLAGELADG